MMKMDALSISRCLNSLEKSQWNPFELRSVQIFWAEFFLGFSCFSWSTHWFIWNFFSASRPHSQKLLFHWKLTVPKFHQVSVIDRNCDSSAPKESDQRAQLCARDLLGKWVTLRVSSHLSGERFTVSLAGSPRFHLLQPFSWSSEALATVYQYYFFGICSSWLNPPDAPSISGIIWSPLNVSHCFSKIFRIDEVVALEKKLSTQLTNEKLSPQQFTI